MRLRSLALAVMSVTAAAVVVPTGAASAASCYQGRISRIGGEAVRTVCPTYLHGTIKDTRADGKCAYYWVNWRMSDGTIRTNASAGACPNGTVKSFYFTKPAGATGPVGEDVGFY